MGQGEKDAAAPKPEPANSTIIPKPQFNDPRFRIQPLQQIASACTGALITALFMTPLDVVKTRIQAQQSALMSKKCFLYCNGLMDHLCPCEPSATTGAASAMAKKPPQLNGTVDAILKISRAEGFASLWSGLSPTLVSALPSTIIYFVAYEQFKARFLEFHYSNLAEVKGPYHGREIPFLIPLISGMSSRICAVTFVSPIELIRTKMQSEKMTYAQIMNAVRTVVHTQGIKGLWRGLPPTILRDVPFSGIYWTCYESIKSYYNVVEPTFGLAFLAGATSGMIAATITTPFDVIKTHEQIEFGEKVIFADKPMNQLPPRSVFERIASIYRSAGLKGVFAGLGPRLLKVAPACAIMISTFEHSKSFFYQYNINRYNEALLVENKP